ncbi:type-F conjugative transfer system pilin assembly protein TrbC [Sphingobium chungbukense]|uniref:Type-F conjugative transfer system pilin assembly protein TrbC n=1 Tax=Sphingobium chungbukense TaxID=56193 RepID=A0A0M3AJX0_9SPHN|nr:type-F conjugative transfer system pilin assembly protein TrbC [Sphingobium chungbukense]KKW90155.1 type-F conjugative transfer system pilin assembly protein TrbC [Sphingobium chungbukense]
MERLRGAIARQKDDKGSPVPVALPTLPEDQRRRAFDAIGRRVRSTAQEDRAKAALTRGTAAMDGERAAMARRLGQALGLDEPDRDALAGAAPALSPKAWVPVLFASSSMPLATLRTYAAQLEKVGGVIAFRGMPGGMTKIGPMAKLTAQTLRIDPGCDGPACAMRNVQVIVDPLVFRQHHVTQVPALAMVPGDPTKPYCERDEDSLTASHIIYGDAALSGLLTEYARLGGTKEVADAQARLERR